MSQLQALPPHHLVDAVERYFNLMQMAALTNVRSACLGLGVDRATYERCRFMHAVAGMQGLVAMAQQEASFA